MSFSSYPYGTPSNVTTVPDNTTEPTESNDWQPSLKTSPYSYDKDQQNTPGTFKPTTTGSSPHETSTAEPTPAADSIIYTKNPAETERYLDDHGITLCKGPDVIRRTVYGDAVNQEQRICLRYLQPPPLPKPGALTVEEIRKQTVTTSKLVIREQDAVADTPPPLILRERPPTPPVIPGPEKKTVIIPTEPVHQRSVVIERHAAVAQKPRDIVIERWLPYGPIPEREVIVKKIDQATERASQTCTIVNYEYPQGRLSRRIVVVDVNSADPNDYRARYRESLLNSSQLIQEARRLGVNEDISSPSTVGVNVERKTVGYRESRDTYCDCFSSGPASASVDLKLGEKSSYGYSSRSEEVSSTMRSEYRAT